MSSCILSCFVGHPVAWELSLENKGQPHQFRTLRPSKEHSLGS